MSIRGFLDDISPSQASGWAFSPEEPGGLLVQALLNTEIIGEAIANIERPDLREAGIGDGRCGFTIQFRRRIDPAYLPFIAVKPDGSDVEFTRWHPTGLVEFLSALYRGHPANGRHRSLFGGLWTDRVNAAALLRGKLAAGQIGQEDEPKLAALIENGFAVLDASDALPAATQVDAGLVGAELGPDTVRLLMAILEDHPVVLSAGIVSESQPLGQPSTLSELGGQNECLMLVAPLGEKEVCLEVVRASHCLPEFTAEGKSRWLEPDAVAGCLDGLRQSGFLDVVRLPPGSVAMVGPGTLQRVCGEGATRALRLVVVPERDIPATLATLGERAPIRVGERIDAWL